MADSSSPLFPSSVPRSERGFPAAAIGIAGGLVAVILGVLITLNGRHRPIGPGVAQPLDPYAASLVISDLSMSESTSLSGGKSTFLDGRVTNRGRATVSGATVQIFFKNDEAMPAHIETVPLALIRTREPYVDTQPVAAAPLAPGNGREFRLIFESIPANWNTQLPEVRVVQVTQR